MTTPEREDGCAEPPAVAAELADLQRASAEWGELLLARTVARLAATVRELLAVPTGPSGG